MSVGLVGHIGATPTMDVETLRLTPTHFLVFAGILARHVRVANA